MPIRMSISSTIAAIFMVVTLSGCYDEGVTFNIDGDSPASSNTAYTQPGAGGYYNNGGYSNNGEYGNNGGAQNGAMITVYEHSDFNGRRATVRGGSADLANLGFANTMSSFQSSGSWEACTGINFSGQCRVFTGTVANLQNTGMNDRIQSIRIAGPGSRGGQRAPGAGGYRVNRGAGDRSIVLYQHADFNGERISVQGNNPDLSRRGFGNMISSLQASGPWELCTGVNFTGRCLTFLGPETNLTRVGMNDQVLSARPVALQ